MGPRTPWPRDDVAGAWSVVGIFAPARGREPIFSGAEGTRGRPGAKGPDLRLGQRHVVGREAGKGGSCGRGRVGPPPRWIVRLWTCGGEAGWWVMFFFSRGCQVRNWWLTFRLAGDNILRLCWMNSWLVLIWLLNTSRKKWFSRYYLFGSFEWLGR